MFGNTILTPDLGFVCRALIPPHKIPDSVRESGNPEPQALSGGPGASHCVAVAWTAFEKKAPLRPSGGSVRAPWRIEDARPDRRAHARGKGREGEVGGAADRFVGPRHPALSPQ